MKPQGRGGWQGLKAQPEEVVANATVVKRPAAEEVNRCPPASILEVVVLGLI